MREENKEKIIQDALNMLDDELILEADELREKAVNAIDEHSSILKMETIDNLNVKKKMKSSISWRRITTIAAGIAVFFIAGTIWNEVIVPNQADMTEGIVEESAVEETYNYPNGFQDTDTVIIEHCEDCGELNATQDISEIAKSESEVIKQESETVIHLPDQKVEAAVGLESLSQVMIPAMQVELSKSKDGVMADMLGFFIYEGRSYVQDVYYKTGSSIVGDYVGTSVGLIDEWTSEDGYVDYAGSVSGKFYEVKGYDPAFMLCMKFDNGAVETFINNNGISLGKGSDLIEERLHLKDNYEKVTFKTQKEWDESLQGELEHVLPEKYDTLMNQFIESFSSNIFMCLRDTPLDTNGTDDYHRNTDNYYLTFHTKDGLRFDFILYEDGYVCFQGLNSVFVQIDSNLYEMLIAVMKEEG